MIETDAYYNPVFAALVTDAALGCWHSFMFNLKKLEDMQRPLHASNQKAMEIAKKLHEKSDTPPNGIDFGTLYDRFYALCPESIKAQFQNAGLPASARTRAMDRRAARMRCHKEAPAVA